MSISMTSSADDSPCPDVDVLLDASTGRVPLTRSLEAHLAKCEPCRVALAGLLRTSASMIEAAAPSSRSASPFGALGEGDLISSRFRLVRVIGSGGAGTVWEALDERRGGLVAVKILRRFEKIAARRQRREARIAMALVHPAIAPVLELVEEDQTRGPVLVMPLYRGEALDALLERRGRLDVSEAARLLVPVLDALAFAHAHGVVHRDVKPANVFVAEDGVRVLDFGLAKLLEEAAGAYGSRITRPGEVLGTPRFMAPEQVFGEREIDARADVWSAGALAYLTLSGVPPIDAVTLGETARAHAHGPIAPLRTLRPDVPEVLANAIMHALVADRDARAGTARELQAAFATVALDAMR
jgi:serine/threonine-protein kinase